SGFLSGFSSGGGAGGVLSQTFGTVNLQPTQIRYDVTHQMLESQCESHMWKNLKCGKLRRAGHSAYGQAFRLEGSNWSCWASRCVVNFPSAVLPYSSLPEQ